MEFFFVFLIMCLMFIGCIGLFVILPAVLLINEIRTTNKFKMRLDADDPYIRAHWTESVIKVVIGSVGIVAIIVIFSLFCCMSSECAKAEPYDGTEMSISLNPCQEEPIVEDVVEVEADDSDVYSKPMVEKESIVEEPPKVDTIGYSGSYFKRMGIIEENGWKYTWYSSNVLRHYRTGEWYPDEQGIYHDSDGYVVVAVVSDRNGNAISFGEVVPTPFGLGKKYDSGCDGGTIDIYVSW